MIFSSLLAALVVTPLIELWVILQVSELYGWRFTLMLVVLTGIIGAWLARTQGILILRSIQRDLSEGRIPTPQMMDGVMILLAGALLITPGLLSDVVGFLLLAPPVRVVIRSWLRRLAERKIRQGNVTFIYRE